MQKHLKQKLTSKWKDNYTFLMSQTFLISRTFYIVSVLRTSWSSSTSASIWAYKISSVFPASSEITYLPRIGAFLVVVVIIVIVYHDHWRFNRRPWSLLLGINYIRPIVATVNMIPTVPQKRPFWQNKIPIRYFFGLKNRKLNKCFI